MVVQPVNKFANYTELQYLLTIELDIDVGHLHSVDILIPPSASQHSIWYQSTHTPSVYFSSHIRSFKKAFIMISKTVKNHEILLQ
jgi:hypothetical protein